MIELSEANYRPLETFRLVWRWTDTRWNLLPKEDLDNIRPLDKAKANEIAERTLVVDPNKNSKYGFVPGLYELVARIDTATEDVQRVRDWLRRSIPDLTQRVVLSWNQNDAVVTTAATFCNYWDDFCYAGSDDVGIMPLSEDWMLFWWHEKVFYFGHPRS